MSDLGERVYIGNNLVSWRSKLHPTLCMSTAEAEYIAASEAAKETAYLQHLLAELRIRVLPSAALLIDNAACIHIASNGQVSGRTKHIELRHHYVRDRVAKGSITLYKVNTKHQRADAMTKVLPYPALVNFRTLLMSPTAAHPLGDPAP